MVGGMGLAGALRRHYARPLLSGPRTRSRRPARFDHAGALVVEDDGERVREGALDDLEIGVAEAARRTRTSRGGRGGSASVSTASGCPTSWRTAARKLATLTGVPGVYVKRSMPVPR